MGKQGMQKHTYEAGLKEEKQNRLVRSRKGGRKNPISEGRGGFYPAYKLNYYRKRKTLSMERRRD